MAFPAPAMPVQNTGQPLVEHLPQGNGRQWSQMGIGKMGKGEHGAYQDRAGSGTADQNTGYEHQRSAQHNLKHRLQERRVHVARPDPSNGP